MSLSTFTNTTEGARASVNTGERSRYSITKESPSNSFTKEDKLKKYQRTPQDSSHLAPRPAHLKPQQDTKKALITLPFTFQSKTTSSLDLRTHLLPPGITEQKTPQTPDNTKDYLSVKTEETNFKKSEEKKEPEQLDNDVLFENFDKYFKIQFPSAKKDMPQNQYSPRKINKTLIFNEGEESLAINTSHEQTLNRNPSRHDLTLKYEKPLLRGPSHYTSLQIKTGLNHDYCPIITDHSKNYSLHTDRAREEKDKTANETSKQTQLVKDRLKQHPILPLPRVERKEIRGVSRYNNNTDSNESYQIYDKDPIDTSSSNKDYINDNWKVFEKTRVRLGALHPNNHYRGANINTTINNSRTYVTNRTEKEDYGADTYVCANIERRRRNVDRRAGTDRLSQQLITLKDDIDNKENINTLKSRADYIQRYDRYSRDISGINQSIDESNTTSKTLQTDQIKQMVNAGFKEIQDSFQNNHRRASGRHALALRDITNQIAKLSQDGVSTRREYYPQAEKKIGGNIDNNPYIPKPASEILRANEQQREKRRVSHMMLREECARRSTSAPRR